MATLPPRQGLPPRPDKVWYRIGEVAELLGVGTHVVRFWQGQFPSVRPERSSTGRFLYTPAAVERLQRIRNLLHEQGFTIAGARKALAADRAAGGAKEGGERQDAGPRVPEPPVNAPVPSVVDPARERRIVELEADTQRQAQELRALAARLQASESSCAAWQAREAALDARLVSLAEDLTAQVDALTSAVVDSKP